MRSKTVSVRIPLVACLLVAVSGGAIAANYVPKVGTASAAPSQRYQQEMAALTQPAEALLARWRVAPGQAYGVREAAVERVALADGPALRITVYGGPFPGTNYGGPVLHIDGERRLQGVLYDSAGAVYFIAEDVNLLRGGEELLFGYGPAAGANAVLLTPALLLRGE